MRYSVAFDPEAFCDVAIDLLREAGVRLRLHSWCAHTYAPDGRIEAVVLESKRGREVVQPRVVVDATGDGDVMVAAGAAFESVTIPPHLWFRMGGLERRPAVDEHRLSHHRARPACSSRGDRSTGGSTRPIPTTSPRPSSSAATRCAPRLHDIREAHPEAWLDDVAKMIGITESRRLVGDYVLEKSDGDRRFPDAIARTGHWTQREVVFDVPYRSLTTATVRNLLVSGRCISASRYVHQATKEIPAAMATGEAAGAAGRARTRRRRAPGRRRRAAPRPRGRGRDRLTSGPAGTDTRPAPIARVPGRRRR